MRRERSAWALESGCRITWPMRLPVKNRGENARLALVQALLARSDRLDELLGTLARAMAAQRPETESPETHWRVTPDQNVCCVTGCDSYVGTGSRSRDRTGTPSAGEPCLSGL